MQIYVDRKKYDLESLQRIGQTNCYRLICKHKGVLTQLGIVEVQICRGKLRAYPITDEIRRIK